MAIRSSAWCPIQGGQLLREGLGQLTGLGLWCFLWGWSGCSRGSKRIKRQKTNLLFIEHIPNLGYLRSQTHLSSRKKSLAPLCLFSYLQIVVWIRSLFWNRESGCSLESLLGLPKAEKLCGWASRPPSQLVTYLPSLLSWTSWTST